jgi:hypothetical protein
MENKNKKKGLYMFKLTKRMGMILPALLLISTGCANKAPESKESDLIAHWTFDDVSGDKVKDASGAHDGVIKGKNFVQKGLYGNAALFDRGRNSAVVPHSDDLSLVDDFTIECVIKPFAVGSFRTIMWKGYRSKTPEEINYYIDIRDGKVELKTKDKDGNWTVFSTRKPVLEDNKWYDIIITYKQGKADIYVNGIKRKVGISEKMLTKKTLLANKHELRIGVGAGHLEPNYFFSGLIDDIKIYKGVKVDVSKEKMEDFSARAIQCEISNLEKKASKIAETSRKLENLIKETGSSDNMGALNSLQKVYDKGLASNEALLDELNRQIALLEYKNYYVSSFGDKAPFGIAVLPSSKRLVKKKKFFKDIKTLEKEVSLKLARNEREGFQTILLGNPFNDIKDIKVSLEDLKHENGKDIISSKNIECAPVASIETPVPEIDVEFTGKIPDVIMEGGEKINVEKNDFTPVFVRIYADKRTVPGNYSGKIKFSLNGVSKELTLNAKVYSFELPEKNSLIVAFSFFEHFYKKWYGYKKLTDEQKMGIYKFLLKYRIPPNNIYSGSGCYPEIKFLKKLVDKGGNFCTLKSLGGSKLRSQDEINKILKGYRENINKLKAAGFYKYAYFYGYDELDCHLKSLKSAKQMMPLIMKEFPDLRLMQTSFPTPRVKDLFNVWVPSFSYFTSEHNLKILDEMRKKPNAEIWWYNADNPRKPYPNYFLDYPVFDCRIIMSLSYMYKVKGILYWSINREWKTNDVKGKKWPEVAWKPYIFSAFTGVRKYVNGMGNFTYPGLKGKIYPSLRLENFRDGIEDYEYYKLLETKVAELKKSKKDDKLLAEAEELLAIPATVATAVNNFSPDPVNLMKHREKVAEMITRLSEK